MDLPGRTISAFVDVVTDRRSGLISTQRTGQALHISLSHLAWVAQLDRDTLIQQPGSSAVQARLNEVVQIVFAVCDLLGGDAARATAWSRQQPLAGFDRRTAEELVAAGHAPAMLEHLAMLRDGGYP